MKSFIFYALACFKVIPWFLSGMVTRREDVIVYGSWFGQIASDNAFELFLWARSNGHKNHFFVTTDQTKLHLSGVIYIYSLRSVLIHLRAKYVFLSSGKGDVLSFLCRNATFVNLWHGSPIKAILKTDEHTFKRSWEKWKKSVLPFLSEYNYRYVLSEGSFFDMLLCESFNIDETCLLKTGSPRNVRLLNSNLPPSKGKKRVQRDFPGCRVLAYMPTFRKSYEADYFDTFNEDVSAILDEANIVIVTKLHIAEISNFNVPFRRILKYQDYFSDTDSNDFLAQCDGLISDYSSAIFDFMILKRPITLFAFDLERYQSSERRLLVDLELLEIPIVTIWEDIVASFVSRLSEEVDYSLLYTNYLHKNCCKNIFDIVHAQRA